MKKIKVGILYLYLTLIFCGILIFDKTFAKTNGDKTLIDVNANPLTHDNSFLTQQDLESHGRHKRQLLSPDDYQLMSLMERQGRAFMKIKPAFERRAFMRINPALGKRAFLKIQQPFAKRAFLKVQPVFSKRGYTYNGFSPYDDADVRNAMDKRAFFMVRNPLDRRAKVSAFFDANKASEEYDIPQTLFVSSPSIALNPNDENGGVVQKTEEDDNNAFLTGKNKRPFLSLYPLTDQWKREIDVSGNNNELIKRAFLRLSPMNTRDEVKRQHRNFNTNDFQGAEDEEGYFHGNFYPESRNQLHRGRLEKKAFLRLKPIESRNV